MEKLVTEYSLWYIPLCVLAGLAYALILYLRERSNEYPPSLRWWMGGLRTLVVAVLAFFLLNPLIRSFKKETEKPVVIVLQDNSASVPTGKDSAYYRGPYTEDLETFIQQIERKYSVRPYTFGNDLKEWTTPDFNEPQTAIGNAFDEVYNRFAHKNVGALILLSDGINNLGANPLYRRQNFIFPVYTVALGDTAVQRDIRVSKVNYNRIAYLDNFFPIELSIAARKCAGTLAEVMVLKGSEEIYRETLSLNSDNEFKTLRTTLPAKETGLQKYTVRVSSVPGEISVANNTYNFYIDVLEDKQKILLLADAPHPDVSAIKQAILSNINYELDNFLIRDFSGTVAGYNLVILHGLPSSANNSTKILDDLEENNIPAWFVLLKNSFYPLFNEQKTGLSIGSEGLIYNEALPFLNPDFTLFSLSDETSTVLDQLPPLISPYGSLQQSPASTPLIFQQVGSVVTDQPLWIFNQAGSRKTSVTLGGGIWKWRLKEYAANENHAVFNELVNKTIQFLALKVDKSLFRVYGKNNYPENADIEFEAELYNDVYELINDRDINITLTGSDGTDYPYTFTTTSKAYYLNAGSLPPDNYSYSAEVVSNGESLVEKGEFSVSEVKLETMNTQADHNLLFNLAEKYGGKMVYTGQLEDLASEITSRDDIRTVSYFQKRYSEVLNLPWVLGLLLLLLSVEWFLRKRAGGY